MIIVTQNPKIEYNKMKSLCEKGVFDKYRLIWIRQNMFCPVGSNNFSGNEDQLPYLVNRNNI